MIYFLVRYDRYRHTKGYSSDSSKISYYYINGYDQNTQKYIEIMSVKNNIDLIEIVNSYGIHMVLEAASFEPRVWRPYHIGDEEIDIKTDTLFAFVDFCSKFEIDAANAEEKKEFDGRRV